MKPSQSLVSTLLLIACLFILSATTLAATPIVGQPQTLPLNHHQRVDAELHQYGSYRLDLETFAHEVRTHGRVVLTLADRTWDIELQPVDVRATDHRVEYATGRRPRQGADIATYRGRVIGEPNSDVRLLALPDLLQGFVRTDAGWVFIDPLRRFLAPASPDDGPSADHLVVYRDVDLRNGLGSCGNDDASVPLAVHGDGFVPYPMSLDVATHRTVSIATDADYEYFKIYGSNSEQQIQGIINQVNSTFSSQVGITFAISFQNVWNTPNQPYTTTNTGLLLQQVTKEWNQHRTTVTRDLAHLFTGKTLDNNIIGSAWLGVVWRSPQSAYGVNQNFSAMAKLTAHEIGHNFNADHVCDCGSCSLCDGNGPIMCSCIQEDGPQSFDSGTACVINNFIDHYAP